MKARLQGPTYDEAYTYFKYAQGLDGFLQIDLANNHPLNSFLVALVGKARPFDTFAIRLPNLLSLLVYLAASVVVARRESRPRRYVLIAFLWLNPFLFEFFTLARGYGICAALVLLGISILSCAEPLSSVSVFLVFAISSLANGAALVMCAAFAMVERRSLLAGLRRLVSALMTFGAVVICGYSAYGLWGVTRPGKPLYAARGNYLDAVVGSFVRMWWFRSGVSSSLVTAGALVLIALVVGPACRATFTLVRNRQTERQADSGPRSTYLLMMTSAVILFIATAVFHAPVPLNRGLLPFYPLVVVGIFVGWRDVATGKGGHRSLAAAAAAIAAAMLTINFIAQLDLTHTHDWRSDEQYNAIYNTILTGGSLSREQRDLWCGPYHPSRDFLVEALRLRLKKNPSVCNER